MVGDTGIEPVASSV